MAKKRAGSASSSLRRRVGIRAPRKTLQIFCEGERTEIDYLRALKRHPDVRGSAAVELRVEENAAGSVPLTLVNIAVAAARRADDDVDEIWCVFDVEWPDNHPNLHEARDKAKAHGIHLAISNPCFELWLILHYREHSAWLDNAEAERLRRSLDGQPGKRVDGGHYMDRRLVAADRADHLAARHRGNATAFPNDNPSSGMADLIRSVIVSLDAL